MIFIDIHFLFYFLPLALIAHRISIGFKTKPHYGNLSKITIFLITLFFYSYNQRWWLIPFLIAIIFDFIWASALRKIENPKGRKGIVVMSVIQNLSLLGFFKYSSWFLTLLSGVFPSLNLQNSIALTPELPPGISFYIFESMSFVIDAYRREIHAPRNPMDFFAFIGMFPRFIAGPIVRYKDLSKQFQIYSGGNISAGLYIFVTGFAQKILLADSFAVFTEYAFNKPPSEPIGAWLGILAYTFQIYFDFSGYSLMAIGLGRCLGFQFETNFNRPYLAASLQDFWRRWHMSLSRWLRDYLYIPLGGNRKGTYFTYQNLMLTMAIGGLWHGAGGTFVIWGIVHGAGLCIEKFIGSRNKLPDYLNKIITFIFVVNAWVLFRAPDIAWAKKVYSAMYGFTNKGNFNFTGLQAFPISLVLAISGIIYCFFIESRTPAEQVEKIQTLNFKKSILVSALAVFGLIMSTSSTTSPFIYFRF